MVAAAAAAHRRADTVTRSDEHRGAPQSSRSIMSRCATAAPLRDRFGDSRPGAENCEPLDVRGDLRPADAKKIAKASAVVSRPFGYNHTPRGFSARLNVASLVLRTT